jgi:hypothetical protein
MTVDDFRRWVHRIDKPISYSEDYNKYKIDPIEQFTSDMWDKFNKYLNGHNVVPVTLTGIKTDSNSYYGGSRVTFQGEITGEKNVSTKQRRSVPAIKKVIFNYPATIVFWEDGTKTVVKMQDHDIQNGELFDPEKGLALAIAKKALGNEGKYFNDLKPWIKSFYEEAECEACEFYSMCDFE